MIKNIHKQKIVLVGACIVISLIYFIMKPYINPSYLHEHIHMFYGFVHDFYVVAVGSYIVCYMLATVFSIPGSSMFTLAGGFLFGIWPGIVYALVAATSGATVLFLISRYYIGSWVQQRYADNLLDFNREIETYGHYYLLVVRLIALLPFCIVNIISGLTLLPITTYIWVTFVGLIPVCLIYTYAGKQLSQLQSVDDFYSISVVTGFVVFILLKVVFVPVLIKMYRRFRSTYAKKTH